MSILPTSQILKTNFNRYIPLDISNDIVFQTNEKENILLTLTMPNFLNGIFHPPFLELSIIIFSDVKMKTQSWSANSIEPGVTARMCRLAWLYTGGKGYSLSVLAG